MCFQLPELKGVSQKGAGLCASDRLDVVLHGDSFLQKKVGRGPKDGGTEPPEAARLSRKLLGGFQPVGIVIKSS